MKDKEKLLITLLKCFVDPSCATVYDFLKTKILEAYTFTEKKLKYKNSGYYFLLGFYNKNVDRLIYDYKKVSDS
jgi:hypothetical protein